MTNVLKGFFKKPEDEANIANAAAAVSNALGEQLKPFENFNETHHCRGNYCHDKLLEGCTHCREGD